MQSLNMLSTKNLFSCLIVCLIILQLPCFLSLVSAQETIDIVISRKPGSENTVKRKGTIVDWRGGAITIESTGRQREIDNDHIVDVQTAWNEFYQAGLKELRQGRVKLAIEQFGYALEKEKRAWAVRIIRSHLIESFLAVDQPDDAVKQFLEIVAEDPQTRFLYLAPLPWAGSGNALVQQAEKWIEVRQPIAQLMGASWLLAGPKRSMAIKKLEELSRDIDPRIRCMAVGQLWRTRANVSQKQTEVWEGLVEKMPREFRAGPLFVLADAQSKCQKTDLALINLMRIPILYPQQRSLGAAALYRCASLLHNKGQAKQSKAILNELVTKYPETIWAQQADQNNAQQAGQ